MRLRALIGAAIVAGLVLRVSTERTVASTRPGIAALPCPVQAWQPGDPTFEALPGAKAFFGKYDGGLYRIEIPDPWNGELALYAHGFVTNGGARARRCASATRRFAITSSKGGYAWAASSYRCNGYVPGQGLVDTMALTDCSRSSTADERRSAST